MVFSSSCAVYGEPEFLPIPEDHPQRPINPYGHSKLFVERMLADLATASGLCWMALRYFNAVGADPDGEIGEAHDPETHLVPLVLAADRDGVPVRIFGDDYDTPDGTCVRDYVHVADIADAHVKARSSICSMEVRVARSTSPMRAGSRLGKSSPWPKRCAAALCHMRPPPAGRATRRS